MPELSAVIVDDEGPARERLAALVAELPGWRVAGHFATAVDALEHVARERPDVVLLDIRMPGMSGLEAARHLAAFSEPPAVVFTTAYDQYAVEAFESRAVGYLLKPVRRERLADALSHAARLSAAMLAELNAGPETQPARRYLTARRGDEIRLVPVKRVAYFRAEQKYVVVCHAEGEELIEESLKQLADEFADDFVRIHRSVLVAVAHIEALEKMPGGGCRVRLRGIEGGLPVSRRQLADVKNRLGVRR